MSKITWMNRTTFIYYVPATFTRRLCASLSMTLTCLLHYISLIRHRKITLTAYFCYKFTGRFIVYLSIRVYTPWAQLNPDLPTWIFGSRDSLAGIWFVNDDAMERTSSLIMRNMKWLRRSPDETNTKNILTNTRNIWLLRLKNVWAIIKKYVCLVLFM